MGAYNQYKATQALKKVEREYKRQIEQMQRKNEELEYELLYYDSDVYIEKIAREQLSLVKSNEILFFNRSTE